MRDRDQRVAGAAQPALIPARLGIDSRPVRERETPQPPSLRSSPPRPIHIRLYKYRPTSGSRPITDAWPFEESSLPPRSQSP